ncbi:MAG: glycosyl hydrolase [Nevskiaceae bacterium]|nr:MAG: glycosyl hydrolase [Nevskiaceae bacterium]
MKPLTLLLTASLIASSAHAADTVTAVSTDHATPPRWSTLGPSARVDKVASAPILAATKAGNRTVAVGDHGVILLSDDGVHFRQAKTVPYRSLLTTVQLVDAQRGYAGGHDGVLLGTKDGGETWVLLRSTPGVEKPVMSLHFDSAEHGFAVGLYGWAVETSDGGKTWTDVHVGDDKNGDRHLFHLFISLKGTWLIAGEQGTVFRSADSGKTWQGLNTGDQGSLWNGLALTDGTLLVCGMRGHIYRSTDDGLTWQAVASDTTQSLTGIAQMPDGSIVIVGLDGGVLSSKDHGATFTLAQREQGEPLTDVLANGAKPLLFSMIGPLP